MSEMTAQIGKVLVIFGVVMLAMGLILILGSRFSFFGLGKLPGDIAYKGRNFSFYFPIVTCLLLSSLVTLIFWLFSYFSRK
jgi:hypothetical protein